MPYEHEFANKSAHFDIVKNPEVARFLDGCSFLKPPSDEESQKLAARFTVPPGFDATLLPDRVIAVDGSLHESSINDKLPSTKIGYVKIGSVLIDMSRYGALRVDGGRFVDPFRVAEIENSNSPLTFSLPSANIRTHGKKSVRDSFRAVIDEHLYSTRTRFVESDAKTSLRTTLFHLAAERSGVLGTGAPEKLRLHKCPNPECEKGPIELLDIPDQQNCPHCSHEVYPSDCLRVWEEVTDFQSNYEAMSRFMLQVEHMLPIHYARFLMAQSPASLSSTVFFLDGPLAVFGNGAWLHAAILQYLDELRTELTKLNYSPVLIIGLQKTGQVADHVNFIERFLPANRIYAIEDEYRYKYILAGRDPSTNGFGSETYYGQDFIYKTLSGRSFVFAIPYPFADKKIPNFINVKAELGRYPDLPKALSLINHFETDLYENAVVPIALAHRYTAISLSPGGRVLDLLTRKAMNEKT
ncbi:MAG TPA: DNA double-strand break repair nuclease NurA [Candidatus Acidoferrales bacterium]|jgi:hypothetical protein|nr:DNA double-strand break repair nuclease NurA [Candidatus Acidoferrales bacterium]